MVHESYNNAEGVMAKQARIAKTVELPTLKNLVYNAIDSIPVETAWVNNKLAFTDESFREVADKMERWYGLEIVFASPELESIRFTGRFENESVSDALEAMQYTARFKFQLSSNTIIISKSTK
jgi:ferric-dicitrate binding protein FerR (iron transport regulator)